VNGEIMKDLRIAFGSFELLTRRGLLFKNGVSVRVGSRALAILNELLEHPGEVVDSDVLMQKVWPDTFVDEANLRVNLVTLRKAIADGPAIPPYILNVPGRGYRFTGLAIRELISNTDDPRPCNLPQMIPELVGREESIKSICAAFSGRRLVTILGPGGIGKTSVAIAAAHQLASAYTDGACFFDLSSLREPINLPGMIQSLLGRTVHVDRSFEDLVAYLRGRD
jgi:DNA-binding winged helix-turn-helix (wHTH) protein